MRRIIPLFLAIGLFVCGCEDDGPSSNEWSKKSSDDVFPGKSTEETQGDKADSTGAGAGDQVSYGSLHWNYGGNGGGAAKSSASIGGLKISGKTLSYSWTGETLSSWGLSNGDASALACLFVQNSSGSWVGGKFDWISTSRTTRNLENVFNGYSGWSLSGVPNPCNAAFVIISKDGKKRTNVITCSWKR